jgi:exopolysaccharide production protein ExoQ
MLINPNNLLLKKISVSLLFLVFFLIDSSFRLRDFDDKEVDFQVIIKILIMAASFVVGSIYLLHQNFYKKYYIYIAFFVYIFATSLWSINPLYTLSVGLSYVSYFIFITFFINYYGIRLFVSTVSSSLFLFFIVSYVLYIFVPDLGRYVLWIDDIYAPTWRMSGLTTSANNFARICAFYIFILLFFKDVLKGIYSAKVYHFQILLAFLGLALSGSRTTWVLVSLVFLIYFLAKSEAKSRLVSIAIILVFSLILLFLSPYLIDFISRDGGGDLTSFTGRTFIWDAAEYFIEKEPIFGYGFGSSIYLLPEFSDSLGFAPPHAHNMYLQLLISGGYIGLSLFLLLIITCFSCCFIKRDLFSAMCLIFIMLMGFFESGAISLTSNMLTLLLFLIINLVSINKKGRLW